MNIFFFSISVKMKVCLVISLLVIVVQSAPATTPKLTSKLKAPSSTQSSEDIVASIEKIQNKFKIRSTEATRPTAETDSDDKETSEAREDRKRKEKMFNFYGFYPPQFAVPTATAYPSVFPAMSNYYPMDLSTFSPFYNYDPNNYYDNDNYSENDDQEENNEVDNNSNNNNNFDYEEDIFSRANNRRRPGNANGGRNSPIFYIRLPPTPYMFVPGMGYISNPPTITPLPTAIPTPLSTMNPYLGNPYATIPTANPYLQQANPFINLPLNFLSNGKPMNVYQYQNQNRPFQQYQPTQITPTRLPQNQYGSHMPPIRQRPYRPNKNPNYSHPDSKITTLKGPFLFNGRPEEIYLLQNLQSTPYNAIYSNPLQSFY